MHYICCSDQQVPPRRVFYLRINKKSVGKTHFQSGSYSLVQDCSGSISMRHIYLSTVYQKIFTDVAWDCCPVGHDDRCKACENIGTPRTLAAPLLASSR